jgi:hypothetical protein
MNLDFDDQSSNGGPLNFEASPKRMIWNPDYFTEWYAPLGTK